MGRLIDSEYLKEDMKRYGWWHVDSTVKEYVDGLDTVEAIPKDQYEARLRADMVSMLTELQLEIVELKSYESADGQDLVMLADIGILFQQKINALKGERDAKIH